MVEVIGTINTVITSLMWIVGTVVILLLIFFVWNILTFKHTVIIRDLRNKRKVVAIDKFRVKQDGGGVQWYQLRRFKDRVPIPPKEALEVDRKGKIFFEAYRLPTGEYIPLMDNIKEDGMSDLSKNFDPLTTNQRLVQFHLNENKMKYKRKTWKDYIIPIVALLSFTTIIIALFVFWGDLAQPVLQMADKVTAVSDQNVEVTNMLKEIIQREQLIQDETARQIQQTQPPD